MSNDTDTRKLPERARTDASLRTERHRSDAALVDKLRVEKHTDVLVDQAREQADAQVDKARVKADDQIESADEVETRAALGKERQLEDQVLERERASTDESLRHEREEQAAALAALLPQEREKTDRFLLTERARSDEALENRDDFLGMVSHDLRNLLSGISLNANVLSATASHSAEGRRSVEVVTRIQRYVARMNRLIGDLLDVVSIDAGKLAIKLQQGDAAALVADAVDAFKLGAANKGVALVAETGELPLAAPFDRERMMQLLANLISNALKFTSSGGRIVVRVAHAPAGGLTLSVADNGIGIAPNLLGAVFKRFWQVDTDDQRGLGLGLYISQCIVDAHGGTIRVESTLGKGSTFYVTIPGAARRMAH